MSRGGRPQNHDPRADRIRMEITAGRTYEAIQLIGGDGIDILDGEAATPLIHAAVEGNVDLVSWLLAHGANADHQDRNGWCALHMAAQYRQMEVASRLLQHGADTNLKDSYGNGPLWTAAFEARGDYGMVELLVSHGADPAWKNNADLSPIDIAAKRRDDKLMAVLKSR